MSDPRYPIGNFQAQDSYTPSEVNANIGRIETLPSRLAEAVRNLTDQQLDTPYREGGWTVRQVVHHVPDSHLNAYIRTKWTLTEAHPTIKAYDEKSWATTAETTQGPDISLAVLKALHAKWVILLRSLGPGELAREFYHPDSKKHFRVDRTIALYAWHGDHHLAHITELKKQKGWK